MPNKSSRAVRVTPSQNTGAVSKLRKQFNNLVQRLEAERKRLAEWHERMPEIRAKADREIGPLVDLLWERNKELVLLLNTQLYAKGLTSRQQDKLAEVVLMMTDALLDDRSDDDLQRMFDELTGGGEEDEPQDGEDHELLKEMIQDMFGVDMGDDATGTPEQMYAAFAAKMAAKMADEQRQHDEHATAKNNKKKPSAREARHQAEESKLQQSVRDIFRKLTSALHPDREQDPDERARKTALMQRVNVAYAANDLLGLLELQLEIDQIDQGSLDRLDDTRIKQYIKILTGQLGQLQNEVMQFEVGLLHELDLPLYPRPTPSSVEAALLDDIARYRNNIDAFDRDLVRLRDVKQLKAWLKGIKLDLPQPDFDDSW